MTMIAGLARRNFNILESLALGVGLAIGCVLIFVYGLGQPLPAWWGDN
jgi:hypothetical protein